MTVLETATAHKEKRITAVATVLRHITIDPAPWRVVLTAFLLLYTCDKKRIRVTRELIEKLRDLAEACRHGAMPYVAVYSVFDDDESAAFEWVAACKEITLSRCCQETWSRPIEEMAQIFEDRLKLCRHREDYITLHDAILLIPVPENEPTSKISA